MAADDSLEGLGEEPKFKVRDTPEWKTHAADLEAEMLKRGMPFNVIDWSDEQESGHSISRAGAPHRSQRVPTTIVRRSLHANDYLGKPLAGF